MKKILQINTVSNGSTGKIMRGIANVCKNEVGMSSYLSCAYESNCTKEIDFYIGFHHERLINKILSINIGVSDIYSMIGTISLIKYIDKLKPDLIHLHNLHGWYLDLTMLFKYIKNHNIPIVWTLHDCWSFTGQCPHFTMAKCDEWRTGCHDCPSFREYPQSRVDRTKTMWKLKKKWFTGVENLTIVTPSQWLADLVKQSFLKDYPVKVINNGIDLCVFRPTESDFRQRYAIGKKKMILGVAFGWGVRKGLDVFIKLAEMLDEDKFQIVIVGTDEIVDKMLPKNMISIHRTQNQKELAEIYTAADVFVNPTREDTFPTVNLESLACGTPVVTFKTGGSPEALDKSIGEVVDVDDIETLCEELESLAIRKSDICNSCINKAKSYDQNIKFQEYDKLYKSLLGI